MRAVKHKLKPLTEEQEQKFLELSRAYQFEKNNFSDQLLNKSHPIFNINDSFINIQNKLVKSQYSSKYQLPARAWKMALKEAYDLHIRTYESQISFVKTEINKQIYQFQLDLNKDKENKSILHCFKYFSLFCHQLFVF